MFLQDKEDGTMIEVLDPEALFSPTETEVPGRTQSGQEEQDPEKFAKANLKFPSGEELPRCWVDADYRNADAPAPAGSVQS